MALQLSLSSQCLTIIGTILLTGGPEDETQSADRDLHSRN